MNHRTVSKIARAFGVSGFALIVAACAAPVGTEDEAAGQEAIQQMCKNGDAYVVCAAAGRFDTSRFEQGLSALGCSGKLVTDGAGQGQDAIYQTRCSLSARATFPCTVCVQLSHTTYCYDKQVTGNVKDLVTCNEGDNHLDAVLEGTSSCGCSDPAPAGDTYVLWDPTCASGSCIVKYRTN